MKQRLIMLAIFGVSALLAGGQTWAGVDPDPDPDDGTDTGPELQTKNLLGKREKSPGEKIRELLQLFDLDFQYSLVGLHLRERLLDQVDNVGWRVRGIQRLLQRFDKRQPVPVHA